MSYSILFRQFPLDHLDALAPVVAEAYGIPHYDARTRIRKGWGFLDRDATEEQARSIVAAVGDLAGGVAVIENTQLQSPAAPQVITAFESSETGLTLRPQSTQQPPRPVAWSEVGIVAAGRFSEEIIHREAGGDQQKMAGMMVGLGVFMVTGLPPGLLGGGKKKKDEKPAKSTRVITFGRIVTTNGEQFAFSPDHFDFTGLGPKKQINAGANFRAFLLDLSERTSAQLNLGVRLLIDNRSLTFANYTGPNDFETELLWMWNLWREAGAA
ncbi:MAG TPA: hypothetical protein VMP11_05560 [Verrucomicrobiae bacterium]|nr:hypothetical protein [Verrucomicrobiae bacterium]